MNYAFKFDVVWGNLGFLLSGIQVTLLVTAAALGSGLVVGLFVALARMSKRRWLQIPAIAYIEIFRNTPALIQLMWVYYCLPILTGLEMSAAASATLALAVNGRPTLPRSSGAASRRSTAGRSKRRVRSACPTSRRCARSCCRRLSAA